MTENQIATRKTATGGYDMMDPGTFEHMARLAKVYANSPLFPEHLRKGNQDQAMANAILVMNIANRLNEDALTVSQNIFFVGGKPGWSSSYMIGRANSSGVFSEQIDWDETGEGDKLSITAFATLAKTGKRVEFTCDMTMAKAEGWTKNAKYQSMPKLMLRYRSGSALIRLYCSEVMFGMPTVDEVSDGDMRDITPQAKPGPRPGVTSAKKEEADVIDADDAKEEAEKKAKAKAKADAEAEAAAEKKRQDAINAEKEAAAKAAEAEQAAKEELKQETPHDPETGEVKQPDRKPDPEQFKSLYNRIVNDMLDAANVDELIDMYQEEINGMEKHAPDLFEQLQREIKDARD